MLDSHLPLDAVGGVASRYAGEHCQHEHYPLWIEVDPGGLVAGRGIRLLRAVDGSGCCEGGDPGLSNR